MKLGLVCFALLLSSWGVAKASAWGEAVRLNGSLKSLNFYSENYAGPDTDGGLLVEHARLDLQATLPAAVLLELAVDQQQLWANRRGISISGDSPANRRFDLDKSWGEGGRSGGLLQLDRLNLHTEALGAQWTFGRQAIGFGRISLFSPLDVIAPFAPDVLDAEVRPGVDAFRGVRYFGLAGQLGGTLVLGDERRHNSYLLTFGENVAGVDVLLLAGRLRGRPMAGIGLAGELGNVGLKGEVARYRGTAVGQPGGDLYGSFTIAALESWYRFDNGLVLLAEYLRNGSGGDRPQEYPLIQASAPYREGLSFLSGQNYLLFGPSYDLHPLVTLNGLVIWNLDDDSLLLRPQLTLSLADNLQLDLFWGWGIGGRTRVVGDSGRALVRSEFGALGNSGAMLLRWYF